MMGLLGLMLPDALRRTLQLAGYDEASGSGRATKDDARLLLDRRSMVVSLHEQMANAENVQEWSQAAVKLDVLEDRELWKVKAESPFYDHKLIMAHIELLKSARRQNDFKMLQYHIRASMHRNFGGLENLRLYEHTHIGTKYLVDDYVNQVMISLDKLLHRDSEQFPVAAKLSFFKELRRIYGRSALLLSGGSVFGLYHLGVVKALVQANLLPQVISGSSAGSLVALLVGVKTDEELLRVLEPGALQFDLFGSAESLLSKFRRMVTEGVVADITYLQQSCRETVGDITFEEAFERTGRILSITVTLLGHDNPCTRILNHLTSPNVVIWSAAIASCAAPGIFLPVDIWCKRSDGRLEPFDPTSRQFLDGSYVNDLPMDELSEMFGVNYFIVSQVNPHVIPFMKGLQKRPPREDIPEVGVLSRVANLFQDFLKSEIHHRCVQMAELGLAPRILEFLVPVINQSYSGDVTIVPEFRDALKNYVTLLSNPSQRCIQRCIKSGMQSTWPALSMIRNHCRIETFIHNGVTTLRYEYYKSMGPQLVADSLSMSQMYKTSLNLPLTNLPIASPIGEDSEFAMENMQMRMATIIVSARFRMGLLGDIAFTMSKLGLAVKEGNLSTCGQWSFTRFHVRLAVPFGRTKAVTEQLRRQLERLLFDDEPTVLVKFFAGQGEIPEYDSGSDQQIQSLLMAPEVRRIRSTNDLVGLRTMNMAGLPAHQECI